MPILTHTQTNVVLGPDGLPDSVLTSFVVFVSDAKQFPKTSLFSSLHLLLVFRCQCPGFAGVHKSTETTRDPMSLIFKLGVIFFSFQMVFIFTNRAAIACAIIDNTSGLDLYL